MDKSLSCRTSQQREASIAVYRESCIAQGGCSLLLSAPGWGPASPTLAAFARQAAVPLKIYHARSPLTYFGLLWLFARLPAVRSVALARAAGDRGGQQDGHGQAFKAASFALFIAMRSHNRVQLPQLSVYPRY
jgi:hypothetical protein